MMNQQQQNPASVLAVPMSVTTRGRQIIDAISSRLKEDWMDLARRTRLGSDMFHHPVCKALFIREREVTASSPADTHGPQYQSLVATNTFEDACSRFARYQAAHFSPDIERWKSERQATREYTGTERPTLN